MQTFVRPEGLLVRMRLALVSGLLAAGTLSTGHAATLASCTGNTVRVLPYPPQFLIGRCTDAPFTMSVPGTVTMTLRPGPYFTGSLSVTLRLGSLSGGGPGIHAYYVAGHPVPQSGTPTELQVQLEAGTWFLDVRAGNTEGRVCPSPPLPTECRYLPKLAFGEFGGSVTG